MFNSITTSEANKIVVTDLTNKFALGAENVIARLAFSHSLAQGKKLKLEDLQDAKGKTYSAKVLFGNHLDIYIAMVGQRYQLHKSDKDISKYVKLHIDAGLQELKQYANSDGVDFLMQAIENGMDGQLKMF